MSTTTKAGLLFLAGGGTTSDEVADRFIAAAGGPNARIVVLGQTREDPARAVSSLEFLKERGAKNVELYAAAQISREELGRIRKDWANVAGFWVPGGDQALFMDRFPARWSRPFFQGKIREGTVWFGTSAGAMIVSDTMIEYSDDDGKPVLRQGLGLTGVLVDTHYRERSRQARMRDAFSRIPKSPRAVGIEAKEWIVIASDKVIEDHGTADVLEK
jgi:cyanophycinase-like exopeptidase